MLESYNFNTAEGLWDISIGRRNRQPFVSLHHDGDSYTEIFAVNESLYYGTDNWHHGRPAGWLYWKPCFCTIAGTPLYQEFKIEVPNKVYMLFVGDSLTQGYNNLIEDTWSYLSANHYGNSDIAAISECVLTDMIDLYHDSIKGNVEITYLVLNAGRNTASGVSTNTFHEQLREFIGEIINDGIIPVVNTFWETPEGSVGQTERNNCIRSIGAIGADFANRVSDPSLYDGTTHLTKEGNSVSYDVFRRAFDSSGNSLGKDPRIKNLSVVPFWNVSEDGIFLAGDKVVVNTNGFAILWNGIVYYIAPEDRATISEFSSEYSVAMLVLKTGALYCHDGLGRNEPSVVLEVKNLESWKALDKSINFEAEIPVALYYKNNWNFLSPFDYYNSDTQVIPLWNVAPYGIYIDGESIKTNANGFGLFFRNKYYYIAPIDRQTEYSFTGSGLNRLLVINPDKLVNYNARTEPTDVLEVINFDNRKPLRNQIVVAHYYKGVWKFVNQFDYFSVTNSGGGGGSGVVHPSILSQNLIAHRGYDVVAPENTIPSFQAAFNEGFKIIEVDVVSSSDDVQFCLHDATIDRTSNGSGRADSYTAD